MIHDLQGDAFAGQQQVCRACTGVKQVRQQVHIERGPDVVQVGDFQGDTAVIQETDRAVQVGGNSQAAGVVIGHGVDQVRQHEVGH